MYKMYTPTPTSQMNLPHPMHKRWERYMYTHMDAHYTQTDAYGTTDAHKGLPYYTFSRFTHIVYSRVVPCGHPWGISWI